MEPEILLLDESDAGLDYKFVNAITATVSFMQKTKTGFSTPEIIGGFEVDGTNSEAAFEGKISLKEDNYLIVTTSKELDGKLKVSLSRENNRIKKSILYVNFQDK